MAGVRRRSARGRSATAGARCESRSRTAWPRGATPRACSIAKVSRALWPSASTTCSASICVLAARDASAPRRRRRRARRRLDAQVDDARCRSGPRRRARSISARILSTTPTSRKVPMCGLATKQDLLRRAGADELVEHLARQVARVADLAPELAVGERAGAAFAELHVRLRIEHAAPPQAPGVAGALAHRACRARGRSAAGPSGRGRARRRCRTGRSRRRPGAAGRSRRSRPARARRSGSACRAPAARAGRRAWRREHRRLVGDLAVDRVDEDDRRLLARVVAAPEDREAAQRVGVDAEPRDDGRAQRGSRVLERQAEFGQAEHGAAATRLSRPPRARARGGGVVSGTLRSSSRPSAARAGAPSGRRVE